MKNQTTENLYINGHKLFKEVTIDSILHRIKDIGLQSPTSLYIHGPFCVNLCNFCQHQGVQIKNNLDKTYPSPYH